MVGFLESMGERLVRLVAPSVTADAMGCTDWQYDKCVGGCFIPWQNKIRYVMYCDGEIFGRHKFGACGGCADSPH
ncbi:hypothetical protein [Nonomuraea typhae]|uniref:hypothetical protein n=1 Tax=Nonomuraea typhae TaxID=2603600 RepID=UPI0012F8906F|nr:hypothetical protein [Nonomuraea typhae]